MLSRLSEATQLHNGAWVATLLGTLLGVQDRKNDNFHERYIAHLALKGLKENIFFDFDLNCLSCHKVLGKV